jgi:hypothetical protein
MAGLGRKIFTAGDVLTASDVQNYLMDQTVMNFAGTAARSSAIATPTEGMVTYLADTNAVEVYDGSAYVGVGGSTVDTVLSSGTFTAVSALNLSSVLSSTYSFYTLNIYAKAAAGTPQLNLRFRENTTDFTGSNYQVSSIVYRTDGSTGNFASGNNISTIGLTTLGTATNGSAKIDITRTSATQGSLSWLAWDVPNIWAQLGAANNVTVTNFNGLSIYPASSTITGYYILTGRKA